MRFSLIIGLIAAINTALILFPYETPPPKVFLSVLIGASSAICGIVGYVEGRLEQP